MSGITGQGLIVLWYASCMIETFNLTTKFIAPKISLLHNNGNFSDAGLALVVQRLAGSSRF